ncbi:hypothetical protein V8C86DRAFT_2491333 [Haematococcus lacustris]
MGGHGGLNILPQKRWNVYNRDNRLKVAQDEAKAKEKEDAEQERAAQNEREYRHQLLLKRARGEDDATAEQPLIREDGSSSAVQTLAVPAPIQHINFWHEEEAQAKAQHPEVEAAQKDEVCKRGKQEFFTTDPKFDERFQLGYNMKSSQVSTGRLGSLSW